MTIAASLADSSLNALAQTQSLNGVPANGSAEAYAPTTPQPRSSVSEMRPLYFQAPFLLFRQHSP